MLTKRELRELISKCQAEYRQNGKSGKYLELCELAYNNVDAGQAIVFVKTLVDVDVKKFGKIVLNEGDAEQNFEFATIQGCDSEAHRNKIIASKDVAINIYAGKQLKDGLGEQYVNKHGEVVLNYGSAYDNFKYLKHNKFKTLDKVKHFHKIIASKNSYINYICAKEIEGANIEEHGKVAIENRDVRANLNFASLDGSARQHHLQVVADFGDAEENFEVITRFGDCNLTLHINKIFSSTNNEVKYECLQWLKAKGCLDKFKNCPPLRGFAEQLRSGKITIKSENLDKNL